MNTAPDVVPPAHDLDAEAAILSAVLCRSDVLELVTPLVCPADFYSEANGRIFRSMVDLYDAGTPVDVVTVKGDLQRRGWLQGNLTSGYLGRLLDEVPAIGNPEQYARTVTEQARARRARSTLQSLAARSVGGEDVDRLLASAQEAIERLQNDRPDSDAWSPGGACLDPEPPIAWVVPDLYLGPGRPNQLQGYGYSGKTTAGMALLLAIAAGLPAWDHYPVQQGVVGHVDYEMGTRALQRKYRRLALAMGIARENLDANLRLCVLPKVKMSSDWFESWMVSAVRRERLSVCLIDSLRASLDGKISENDSEVRSFLDVLLRVSETTGCTFIVIHHTGKGGQGKDVRERGRGSSAIFDAAGTVLLFELAEPPHDASPGAVYVKTTMAKASGLADGKALDPIALRIEDATDKTGSNPRWGLRVSAMAAESLRTHAGDGNVQKAIERVTSILRQHPGISARAVRDHFTGTGMRSGLAYAALDEMERSGLAVNAPSKSGGKWSLIDGDQEDDHET